jgi:DNA-binding response OmpR family regulator
MTPIATTNLRSDAMAQRRDTEVPVLMLSGRGRELDKVEAFDLGADDYLTKPFGVAELLVKMSCVSWRLIRS